jgi:hypothetical protein
MVHFTVVILTHLKGLEWPHTHYYTIQKILLWNFMDGMKLFFEGLVVWSIKNISL